MPQTALHKETLKEQVQQLALEAYPKLVAIREHLHRYPELSFKEYDTHDYLCAQLTRLGIEHSPNVAGTGIVAYIRGKNPGKRCIALRSDHDALPIIEKNEDAYKSQNDGVMHACGHDVHSASHLGALMILQSLRDQFEGTVKCIFQLGEELYPCGASLMIREGVLQHPEPSGIIGTHVMPRMPVGKAGIHIGPYMSSADEVILTIKGKGGHAATPHLVVDPIVMAAQVIMSLQTLVSRNASPFMAAVLSFGKIESPGGAYNVIPNEVKITGGLRTFDDQWKQIAHERIRAIAQHTAQALGGECEVSILSVTPVLHNEEALSTRVRQAMIDYLGEDKVEDLPQWAASEDFAYYTQHIPGCFYRLGIWNPETGKGASALHTDTFDVDPTCLAVGSGLMAWLALQELDFPSGL